MAPRVDPVEVDQQLPAATEVVVVGAGIIGLSTAFFLARKGIPTVVCEKGAIAGEQSSRNWGWCRAMGRDPRELGLAIESVQIWRGLDQLVEGETGFRQTGTLYLCDTEEALAKREAWVPYAREYQLDSRILRSADIAKLMPGDTKRWAGGLHTPSDGVAEPQKAAPAIARAFRRLGGKVLTGCAVRGVETSGGSISAAVTEKGRIACKAVVFAGGAWSRLFLGSLGLRLPQLKVLASVMRTAPVADGPVPASWGPGLALRKRVDGGYTISQGGVFADIVPDSFAFFSEFMPALRMEWRGLTLRFGQRFFDEWRTPKRWNLDEVSPFERVRTLDPAPLQSNLDKAKRNLEERFPAFRGIRILESWGGLIDVTPDVLPVISGVDALPGLFVATGFSGHGFGIGPAAGRLMADLVTGAPPVVDPTPFRFARFSDGTPIKPMAGI